MRRAMAWVLGGVGVASPALLGCGSLTEAVPEGDSGSSGSDIATTGAMSEGMSTTQMPMTAGGGSADGSTTAAMTDPSATVTEGSEGTTLGDAATTAGSSSGVSSSDTDTTNTGGSSSDGSSSSTGGGVPCLHDPCSYGVALAAGCDGSNPTDGCVADICAVDPFCCDNFWDLVCVDQVFGECAVDCTAGLPDCGALFSGTPGYYICSAGFQCAFGYNATMGSCDSVCTAQGTECIDAFNNDGACGLGGNTGCADTTYVTAICICTNG